MAQACSGLSGHHVTSEGRLWLAAHRQKVVGQILAVVDPAVHADESLERGLVLHVGIVQTCVQHDDGKRQDITRV